MEKTEVLRALVARLGGIAPETIYAEFSLQGRSLEGSVRRAALAAAIRRQLGVTCPAAYSATTYGELEAAVLRSSKPATFDSAQAPPTPALGAAVELASADAPAGMYCGLDLELVSELPETRDYRGHEFYRESFSPEEIVYCLAQENPRMHFAARWCAKEALFKCDPACKTEKLADVEVVRTERGDVFLRQRVKDGARRLPYSVSLSHTVEVAAAMVVRSANSTIPAQAPPGSLSVESTAPATATQQTSNGIWVLAWLAATAIAVIALIRTMR